MFIAIPYEVVFHVNEQRHTIACAKNMSESVSFKNARNCYNSAAGDTYEDAEKLLIKFMRG